jgi:hypothetical protein
MGLLLLGAWTASAQSTNDNTSGYLYKHYRLRSEPLSIHVLRIDRSRPDLEMVTTLGEDTVMGLGPISMQIRGIPPAWGKAVAAINGDFYRTEHESYAGDPRGIQILRGEFVSAPNGKACFWIDAQGAPHISNVVSQIKVIWPSGENTRCGLNEERRPGGAVIYTGRIGSSTGAMGGRELVLERDGDKEWLPLKPGIAYTARVRQVRDTGNSRLGNDTVVLSIGPSLANRVPKVAVGAIVTLSLGTSPDLRGARVAVGGGPLLVRGSQPQETEEYKSGQRHPRSALGWNSKYYYFVAVDGRQPGWSMGMNLDDLATYLAALGCEEAMNLDGGGSVEMWIDGRVVNRPCYGHERSTANALVVLRKTSVARQ